MKATITLAYYTKKSFRTFSPEALQASNNIFGNFGVNLAKML